MEIEVNVMNGDDQRVTVPSDGATYRDVLDAVGFNPEGAVVVVDGRPVPDDASVETETVTVMRTVSGGCVPATRQPHAKHFYKVAPLRT